MFRNMNSGYAGYSMSNRAVEAYEDGEKPLSKWRKADIIEALEDLIKDQELIKLVKKVDLATLKDKLLVYSSWHHASSMCNKTDFYKLDIEFVENLKKEDVKKMIEIKPKNKEVKENVYFGNFKYLEWSGSRKHPKATEKTLEDVKIVEKGCFYHVYSKDNDFIIKKKINSNGTRLIIK